MGRGMGATASVTDAPVLNYSWHAHRRTTFKAEAPGLGMGMGIGTCATTSRVDAPVLRMTGNDRWGRAISATTFLEDAPVLAMGILIRNCGHGHRHDYFPGESTFTEHGHRHSLNKLWSECNSLII